VTDVLIPVLTMAVLGLLFALGLVLAYKKLQVPENPRLEVVAEVLPQANCGGCGFAGCRALADCVRACPFEAMAMGEDGLPIVYEDRCTACGKCVEACPRNIMELRPATEDTLVFCRSHDRGPVARKVCDNACIACNICVRDFPDAVVMDNFLAKVVNESKIPRERLDDLDRCPTGAIGRIKRITHDG